MSADNGNQPDLSIENTNDDIERGSFFWDDKAKFEAERRFYVENQKQALIDEFTEEPFAIKLGLGPEEIESIAVTFLRAQYVGNFVFDKMRQDDVHHITPGYTDNVEAIQYHGFCEPDFVHEGVTLNLREFIALPRESAASTTVSDIRVAVNIISIATVIKDHYNSCIDNLPTLERLISETGMQYERYMLEEVAHALFFSSAIKDPARITLLHDELQNYPEHTNESQIDGVDQEEKKRIYLNSPIERKARVWVRSFLKQYYPYSGLRRHESNDNNFRLRR